MDKPKPVMASREILLLCIVASLPIIIADTSLQGSCNTPVGLENGEITDSMIKVSSSATNKDKTKVRYDCCKEDEGAAWCPGPNDQHPYLEIKLNNPKAISGLKFQHPVRSTDNAYLKTFTLKFIPALSASKDIIAFNTDIAAIYNETLSYIIGLNPIIVTNTIRIEPQKYEKAACFRLELLGCEPSGLCAKDFCKNGGKCVGDGVCECTGGFFGSQCETSESQIQTSIQRFEYLRITEKTIETTSYNLSFTGSVQIETSHSVAVLKLQPQSTITVPTKDKCFKDLDNCRNGFTYGLGITLENTQTNGFVILQGGDVSEGSGIQLFYQDSKLMCSVSTSTLIWQLSVDFEFQKNRWYQFEITWSTSFGLQLLLDGAVIGNSLKPGHVQHTASTSQLSIVVGLGIQTTYRLSSMRLVPLMYSEAVRAGVTNVIIPQTTTVSLTSTTHRPTLSTSTEAMTTEQPCKELDGNSTFRTYNFTLQEPSSNIQMIEDVGIILHGNWTSGEEVGEYNLSSSDSFIEIDTGCILCLSNLTACSSGFTIQSWISFENLNKSDVFNSGIGMGESGLSFVINNGRLTCVLQKGSEKWILNTDYNIQSSQYYLIQISWSPSTGLQLFVNNFLLADGKYLRFPSLNNFKTGNLFIGRKASITVKNLVIWSTSRDILVQENILEGPETTTPIPVTSTSKPTTEHLTSQPIPSTSPNPEVGYQWKFTSVSSHTLINNNLQLEIKGNLSSNKTGLYLGTSEQYLEVNELSKTCAGNLDLCSQGLTFEFEIMYYELKENTVIMTTGGESPNTPGIAVVYRFGQIQVIVTTVSKSWYATIPREYITFKHWQKFLISWSLSQSLEVYLNEKHITTVNHFISRAEVQANYTGTLYVGHSFSNSKDIHSINCILKSFKMWHLTVDILIKLELVKCQKPTTTALLTTTTPATTRTTIPKSTTIKPTTSKPTTQPFCPVGCISIDQSTRVPCPTTAKTTQRPTKPPPTTKSTTRSPTTTRPPTTTRSPTTTRPTTTTRLPTTTTQPPTTTLGIPVISGQVQVKPSVDKKGDAFLMCVLQANITSTNVQFSYSWSILRGSDSGKSSVMSETFVNQLPAKDIDENILGKKVFCSVKARYLPNGKWSLVTRSPPFVAKIEIQTKGSIVVVEGQHSENIKVTTNVPPQLLCPTGNKAQCDVHLVATAIAKKECKCSKKVVFPQVVIGWTPTIGSTKPFCGQALNYVNWLEVIKIPIKATIDGLYEKDMYRFVKVEAVITGHIVQKTETHNIGNDIKVDILNRDYKAICASINDPHITSFDGLHYNNFESGEYILYRHKTLPYEVRAYYKPCSARNPKGPSCNCGVAVRSGDDVITLNGCSKIKTHHRSYPITVTMYKNGKLTPGTHIRRLGCGQKYEVVLPTGTYVTVKSSYLSFINIWITPSSVDYQQTEGLCGVYNRNKRDDLTDSSGVVHNSVREVLAFSLSWRASVTMFTGVMAVSDSSLPGPIYCSCVSGYDSYCEPSLDIFRCEHEDKYDITEYIVKQAQLPHIDRPITGRRRRALPDISSTTAPVAMNWTISEEEAEVICEAYLYNSTAVAACKNITQNDNYTQDIANCVSDLHLTGDEGFATAHVDDIINKCIVVARGDAQQYLQNENETTATQKILTTLCEGGCGSNGHCSSGECLCNEGYSGIKCEITKSTKPDIIPVSADNEPCDINIRNCSEVNIMGINFVDTKDLSCHYQPIVVGDTIEERGVLSTFKANYVSMYQIGCPMPFPSSSAYIGVSNDGHTVSDERYLHVVHDSRCWDCSVTGTDDARCIRRKETCYIDGVCRGPGDVNPQQKCQLCNPDLSQLLWSANTDPACSAQRVKSPKDDSIGTDVIALAATCGVLAFILLISLIVICKQRSAAKATKAGMYSVSTNGKSNAFDNPEYQGFDSEKL